MIWRRAWAGELPFAGDPAARFLPGIVALMVFLSGLALAGALVLDGALADWRQHLTARLTVQIPQGEKAVAEVAAAVGVLERTPGVAEVRVMPREEVAGLLEPWLGAAARTIELPLPHLIDAVLEPGGQIDWASFSAELAEAAPDALVDDHRDWLQDFVLLARGLEWLGLAIVLLVGFAAVAAIAFVVKSGLAIHRDVVEILHLVGARDSYIARQFQRHAVRQGWLGALSGALGVAVVIAAAQVVGGRLEQAVFAAPGLGWRQWAMLGLVPVAAVLAAGATARITVHRALSRLP